MYCSDVTRRRRDAETGRTVRSANSDCSIGAFVIRDGTMLS
jgi:hypothetical protein